MVHAAVMAERLAQEAVELIPGDPRPWQALAEACDAQGQLHSIGYSAAQGVKDEEIPLRCCG